MLWASFAIRGMSVFFGKVFSSAFEIEYAINSLVDDTYLWLTGTLKNSIGN